jgi:tetratricopeptide (TPR) repeat protein
MSTKCVFVFSVFLFVGLLQALPQSDSGRREKIDLHNRRAAEYLKANQPELAIPELRAVIALDENNVDALGNLGVLLFFQGDYTKAIPELRSAFKLKPTLWKIQALLGIAEDRMGEVSTGRRDLEEAFPKVQDKKIRIEAGMELVEIYAGASDLDKAAGVVADLRKLDPTNETILYSSYRIYSDLAAESILSLSLVDSNSAHMHQAMAHELAKRGDTAAAIENYRAAIKIDPRLPGVHFELAEMLSTLGTQDGREQAEKEYEVALQINPFDEQSESRLGDIALQRDDLKVANVRFSRALQLQPNDSDADIGLAKVFMTMDQPLKAEPLLLHALKLDPTSPLAHFRLSTVYRQTGRTEDAKRELEEYQKYKKMKDQLQTIYHDLHQQRGKDEDENYDVKK